MRGTGVLGFPLAGIGAAGVNCAQSALTGSRID